MQKFYIRTKSILLNSVDTDAGLNTDDIGLNAASPDNGLDTAEYDISALSFLVRNLIRNQEGQFWNKIAA